jgi:hypothetical protein
MIVPRPDLITPREAQVMRLPIVVNDQRCGLPWRSAAACGDDSEAGTGLDAASALTGERNPAPRGTVDRERLAEPSCGISPGGADPGCLALLTAAMGISP